MNVNLALVVVVAVLLAAAVTATTTTTNDLEHALRHHSSLRDAAHHTGAHKTSRWIVIEAKAGCSDAFATQLAAQVAPGAVTIHSSRPGGICVLDTDAAVDPDRMSVALMSEQRAGRLSAFTRESVHQRASH